VRAWLRQSRWPHPAVPARPLCFLGLRRCRPSRIMLAAAAGKSLFWPRSRVQAGWVAGPVMTATGSSGEPGNVWDGWRALKSVQTVYRCGLVW
jgi:hypothetical protein